MNSCSNSFWCARASWSKLHLLKFVLCIPCTVNVNDKKSNCVPPKYEIVNTIFFLNTSIFSIRTMNVEDVLATGMCEQIITEKWWWTQSRPLTTEPNGILSCVYYFQSNFLFVPSGGISHLVLMLLRNYRFKYRLLVNDAMIWLWLQLMLMAILSFKQECECFTR